MNRILIGMGCVILLAGGSATAAHHEHKAGAGHDHGKSADRKTGGKKGAKAGSVTGTVVDLACQVLGEKPDPGHRGCAEGGVPVGLVDAKGKLWMAIDANYGSATDELLPFMGKKVKATGWFVEKKDQRLISIATVEPVGTTAAGAAKEAWVCPHACSTSDRPGKCHCGLELVKRKD